MAHIITNIIKSNHMKHPSVFDLKLTREGTLPSWLVGNLYFVGPSHNNYLTDDKYTTIHLFDGFGNRRRGLDVHDVLGHDFGSSPHRVSSLFSIRFLSVW